MATVYIENPPQAIDDASLLKAAAADMVEDFKKLKTETDTILAEAEGPARAAFDNCLLEYKAAFERLAATYEDLGNRVIKVIHDSVDADLQAKRIWDTMSSGGAITG